MDARPGYRADAPFHPSSLHEPLRQSAPVVGAKQQPLHVLLIHRLPQISSVAALHFDDAWSGADTALVPGQRHASFAPASPCLRTSAALLLSAAPSAHSRPCGCRGADPLWAGGLALL